MHKKRFGFLGALIFGVMVIGLWQTRQPNVEAKVTQKAQDAASFTQLPYDLYLTDPALSSLSSKTLTLESGDSLGPLLQEAGVSPNEAYEITRAFSDIYDPRQLRVGQSFHVNFRDQQIEHLSYKPSYDRTIFVERNKDNRFIAKDISAEYKTEHVRVKTQIENSLYLDANKLGVPDRAIQQFANIYEYSVDFQRDIQPGDDFELMFEVYKDHHGNIVKSGDLLYTSFSPRGKTLSYYLFENEKGRENFYDETGKTAKRKLRATPVSGARISSGYGNRRHPILGYVKKHKGVDFAAPTGTPIMAAGAGKVVKAGWYGGYGKYIRLKHSDGYQTAYSHLSRYGRGIKAGRYVTQDQIIGYVGTTGRSTGPHLHYEVILNGKHINPRRLSQLSGKPISSEQKPAFDTRRAEIDQWRDNARWLNAPVDVADTSNAVQSQIDAQPLTDKNLNE